MLAILLLVRGRSRIGVGGKGYLCGERGSPLDAGFSPLAYAEEGVIS